MKTQTEEKRNKVIKLQELMEGSEFWCLYHFVTNFLFYADNIGWNADCITRSLRANMDYTNTYYRETIQDLINICEVDINNITYSKVSL